MLSAQNPNFDESLAAKLEADAYGMKTYYLVLIKTGPNETKEENFVRQCFESHMKNINRMISEGKLILAGPFGQNTQQFRGIFILDMKDEQEISWELELDAAISEGLLSYTLLPWYGSAALPVYLETADKIWKVKP